MASGKTEFQAPPTRFLPMLMAIGPAIVVSGSVIGSGELINVPVQAARFGFVLFWAVILSCIIKFFLQIELGRHCIVHNRTTIQAFNQCPGPKIRGTAWIGYIYMIGYTVSVVTVGGIMAATAGLLQSVFPLTPDPVLTKNIWAAIIFVVIAAVLWRGLYGELEKLVAILVAGFSMSVVLALLLLVLFPNPEYPLHLSDILSGLKFSLGDVDRELAAFAVISLLGALGTTANELFMYPYWILEKGYAERLGDKDSDGWVERARGWVRVLRMDTAAATLLATVITAAYFLVGSAILHRRIADSQAEVPSGIELVNQLSTIYTEIYGSWSYGIFMFGGFCTLFSTIVVVVAATGRMWTDLLSSAGMFDWNDAAKRRKCNRVFQMLYLGAFLAITLFVQQAPEKLVIMGQYINGLFNTPIIMFAICWMALHTDRRLRMGRCSAVMLFVTVAIILACLAAGLYRQAVS